MNLRLSSLIFVAWMIAACSGGDKSTPPTPPPTMVVPPQSAAPDYEIARLPAGPHR